MKSNFETEEDLEFLNKLLHYTLMNTDNIFNQAYNTQELMEYRNMLMDLREKVFYFLEEEDPNLSTIELMKSQKKEDLKPFGALNL